MKRLMLSLWRSKHIPLIFRDILDFVLGLERIRRDRWLAMDPYRDEPDEWNAPGSMLEPVGILKEFWGLHWHYVAACRELGVSYRLIDISGPDWLSCVQAGGCSRLIARPSVQRSQWKQMYDERLWVLKSIGRYRIFPEVESLWVWESKRRMNYWLEARNIPHPQTWVFYDEGEALRFSSACKLPIVYKSDLGSGSSGVIVIRSLPDLKKLIRRCFRKGFRSHRRDRSDVEVGFILLQEYLEGIREWRIVRIGDSYFGFEKLQVGQFHSGSHQFEYGRPPDQLLNIVREATDMSGFRSVDFDIFVHPDRGALVNEVQAHFGQEGSREICRVGGQPGRMLFDYCTQEWRFESGVFCQNYLCNLRVQYLIDSVIGKGA